MKISEKNLNSIRLEALRQFEEQGKILERYSNISQIMMGFIIAFFTYSIINTDARTFLKGFFTPIIFISSMALAFLSFTYIFRAYRLENFYLGTDIDKLLPKLGKNKKIDVRVINLNSIVVANKQNSVIIKKKSKDIKIGMRLFLSSFLMFVTIKFIYALRSNIS